MAGNAQNSLGQLFVDIGVGGVGKTLKSLNSISASFLLTKNAALQAVKPFVNIGKEAMNNAVNIGKMAAALGTTTLNAQKLQYYLNKYDSQGLEGSVGSIQSIFTRLQAGYGGIDAQMAMSMGQLGLDFTKYDGSFENTLQFIQDVKDALKSSNMSESQKLMHLQNLGLQDWRYLFEKDDFDINEALNVSDKEIEKLIKSSEALNELGNRFDQLATKATANVLTKTIDTLTDINNVLEGDEQAKSAVKTSIKNKGKSIVDWLHFIVPLSTGIKPTILPQGAKEVLETVQQLFTSKLETIPENDPVYENSLKNIVDLPDSLPVTANYTPSNINVNLNTRINTRDPHAELEILDIDVEPIENAQAQQRNQGTI